MRVNDNIVAVPLKRKLACKTIGSVRFRGAMLLGQEKFSVVASIPGGKGARDMPILGLECLHESVFKSSSKRPDVPN